VRIMRRSFGGEVAGKAADPAGGDAREMVV
jgi:hypothetical protein